MHAGRTTPRKRNGFTLAEMMITVAIVGVLAVLATYGVRKYISNSKTAEAVNMLGVIAKDAAEAYTKEATGNNTGSISIGISSNSIAAQGSAIRKLCPAAATIPATPPKAAKYQSANAEWSGDSGWACLKFQIGEPQYFSYGYTPTNTSLYVATANGDLNGDGVQSTFSITGSVQNGAMNTAVTVQQVKPEE